MKRYLLALILALQLVGQTAHQNVLTWGWAPGNMDPANGYHVWKTLMAGGCTSITSTTCFSIATITNVATKTYTDITVSAGQTSYYVVTSFNAGGDSTPSNQVICVTPFQTPAAPTSLQSTSQ